MNHQVGAMLLEPSSRSHAVGTVNVELGEVPGKIKYIVLLIKHLNEQWIYQSFPSSTKEQWKPQVLKVWYKLHESSKFASKVARLMGFCFLKLSHQFPV